jgi:hypothetical protein
MVFPIAWIGDPADGSSRAGGQAIILSVLSARWKYGNRPEARRRVLALRRSPSHARQQLAVVLDVSTSIASFAVNVVQPPSSTESLENLALRRF